MKARMRVNRLEKKQTGAVNIRVWFSDEIEQKLINTRTGESLTREEWERQAKAAGARMIHVRFVESAEA